ncbi:MAG: hypothetical protein Q9201_001015 [Fulgogasparrea decipioides]
MPFKTILSGINEFHIGQRLSYNGALCTVRYRGEVEGTNGQWLGVEWDDPTKGKHDGSHDGKRYFDCLGKGPTAASFVRPSRRFDQPQDFWTALEGKYGSGRSLQTTTLQGTITISGKQIDEVGFDIIAEKQSAWSELEIVSLDGLRIDSLIPALWNPDGPLESQITRTNLRWKGLDLSNNLFESWDEVLSICSAMKELRCLKLNGNRFRELSSGPDYSYRSLPRLEELSLANVALEWDQVLALCNKQQFPVLQSLSLAFNPLGNPTNTSASFSVTSLILLDLTSCNIRNLQSLAFLAKLPHLATLILRSNPIANLSTKPQIVLPKISSLDLTATLLPSLPDLSPVTTTFPALRSLQIINTPLATSHPSSRLFAVARLPNITSLNHTGISPTERQDAELYYQNLITSLLVEAKTPEEERHILAEHPQWEYLCSKYGEPDSIAQKHQPKDDAPPAAYPAVSLGANLVTFIFYTRRPNLNADDEGTTVTVTEIRELPKLIDVYRLKSIVGPLFSIPPMSVRLIIETEVWDPVPTKQLGGLDWDFSDSEDESTDEDDEDVGSGGSSAGDEDGDLDSGDTEVDDAKNINAVGSPEEGSKASVVSEELRKEEGDQRKKKEKWVKREIEIPDSTRKVADWLEEKKEVRIRVERRGS